jgi:hypothetical protein
MSWREGRFPSTPGMPKPLLAGPSSAPPRDLGDRGIHLNGRIQGAAGELSCAHDGAQVRCSLLAVLLWWSPVVA